MFVFGKSRSELHLPAQPIKDTHIIRYKTHAMNAPTDHHTDIFSQKCSTNKTAAGSSPPIFIRTLMKRQGKKLPHRFELRINFPPFVLFRPGNRSHSACGITGMERSPHAPKSRFPTKRPVGVRSGAKPVICTPSDIRETPPFSFLQYAFSRFPRDPVTSRRFDPSDIRRTSSRRKTGR